MSFFDADEQCSPLQIGITETSLGFHLHAGAFARQKFDNAQNDNDKKCTVGDAGPYRTGEQSCAPTVL